MAECDCDSAAAPLQQELQKLNTTLGRYAAHALGTEQRLTLERARADLDLVTAPSSTTSICAWAPATNAIVDVLLKSFSKNKPLLADAAKGLGAARIIVARCAAVKQTVLAMPGQVSARRMEGSGAAQNRVWAEQCWQPVP